MRTCTNKLTPLTAVTFFHMTHSRLLHENGMALPQRLSSVTFFDVTHSRLRLGSLSKLARVISVGVQPDVCYAQVNHRDLGLGCPSVLPGHAYRRQASIDSGCLPLVVVRMETMKMTIGPTAPGQPFISFFGSIQQDMYYAQAGTRFTASQPITCYGYKAKTKSCLMGCIYWRRFPGGHIFVVFFIISSRKDEIGSAGCTP